jgi:hypothetical protein
LAAPSALETTLKITALKSFTLSQFRAKAGQVLELPDAIAGVLITTGHVSKFVEADAKQVTFTSPFAPSPIDELRASYEKLSGEVPDGRWREGRLEIEIARLKND